MKRNGFLHYVIVRGFFQFGLLAAALYVSTVLLWPGRPFLGHDLKIALACPAVGLLWGAVMYLVDLWKSKKQST
jgi:hypothetical protein